MKIGIAQLNCRVGDIAYNTAKILDYSERARKLGADLLLTPELSISGYPPEDLLLRDEFCDKCEIALRTNGLFGRRDAHPDPCAQIRNWTFRTSAITQTHAVLS